MKKKLLLPLLTALLSSTPSLGTEGAPQIIYEETSEDSFEEGVYQLDMAQAQLLSSIDDLEGKIKELEKLKAKQVKILTNTKKALEDPKGLEKASRPQLLTLMNEAAQKSADYEKQIQIQRQQIEQNQKEVENIKVQLSLLQLEKEKAEKEIEIENLSRQLYQMQVEKEEAERKRTQEEQKPVSPQPLVPFSKEAILPQNKVIFPQDLKGIIDSILRKSPKESLAGHQEEAKDCFPAIILLSAERDLMACLSPHYFPKVFHIQSILSPQLLGARSNR